MKLQEEYYKKIGQITKGKEVLDIGSIQHNFSNRGREKIWNFDVLRQSAKTVLGIDYLKKDVKEAQKEGYKIVYGNAENFVADRKFDLVFAGDLIEHLSNPGNFLECSEKNLKDGGELVILTPNTFSLARLVRVLGGVTNEPPVNDEHTVYFTPKTLAELLRRYGFQSEKIDYLHFPFPKNTPLVVLNYWLCRILGKKFKETILIIAKKK